jgi:hypothetical protein
MLCKPDLQRAPAERKSPGGKRAKPRLFNAPITFGRLPGHQTASGARILPLQLGTTLIFFADHSMFIRTSAREGKEKNRPRPAISDRRKIENCSDFCLHLSCFVSVGCIFRTVK